MGNSTAGRIWASGIRRRTYARDDRSRLVRMMEAIRNPIEKAEIKPNSGILWKRTADST
jgi:3-oxoacyl-[acyl-carrier-protein] synthase III